MKRRAQQQGATQATLNDLQRTAVQDAIKGLDINPVSLQLAASQLTAGNADIRYRRMGLNRMPYGPDRNAPARVAAGSLELLGQKAIVARNGQFDIADDDIRSPSRMEPARGPARTRGRGRSRPKRPHRHNEPALHQPRQKWAKNSKSSFSRRCASA